MAWVYSKLGVQFYDYEISQGSNVLADDSGVGLYLEAGWLYRLDNGFGLEAGIKLTTMGDLTVAGTSVGIDYAF